MSSSLPFIQNIKKMVTRGSNKAAAAANFSNSSSSIVSSNNDSNNNASSSSFNKGITTLKTKVFDTILNEFQEKEWRCSCGHVFRASGDWMACEPSRCEAPRCPNPKFFLDGPGKSMLNKDGTVPIPQQVQALPESCKKGPKGSCGSSRFK